MATSSHWPPGMCHGNFPPVTLLVAESSQLAERASGSGQRETGSGARSRVKKKKKKKKNLLHGAQLPGHMVLSSMLYGTKNTCVAAVVRMAQRCSTLASPNTICGTGQHIYFQETEDV